MRKFVLAIIGIAFCSSISAQDIIMTRDADEIKAKVIKVGQTEIEYKKWENLEGPSYTIPASEVFIIKYKNGQTDKISVMQQSTARHIYEQYPKYQGEVAFGFGVGVSAINLHRVVLETIHGARVNSYFFAGIGLGFNYFYEVDSGGGILTPYLNLKGYYPGRKANVYFSFDAGASCGVSGWANGETAFYTAIGPGVTFGNKHKGDFSIRFQHVDKYTNAIVFRIGVTF